MTRDLTSIFECWNQETRELAAVINAPDLETAIRRIRNELAAFTDAKATADNVFVCAAQGNNCSADALQAAHRFGVWLA